MGSQHLQGPDLTHPSKDALVVVFFPSMKTSRGELTLDFHDLALAVILGIAGLVAPAFVYRLSAPVSHSLLEHENLETAWTLGPIFVLVGLAVPSLQLLYTIDDRAGGEGCVSVKVTNGTGTIRWGYRRHGIAIWLSAGPDCWQVLLPPLQVWGERRLILPVLTCSIVSLYRL